MSLSRRGFMRAGAGALGAAAVTGPFAARAKADYWYPYGIDVSRWQGTINWDQVLTGWVSFAFIKATEGTGYVDPQFARNWSETTRVGILRGAYHYGRPGSSAVNQARHFVDTFTPEPWDLLGVLDIEVSDGLPPAQVWAWVQAFVNEYRNIVGAPPMIYCSPGLWSSLVGNPMNNLGCPLWVAHWGVSWPTVPRAWSSWGWSFWQWSSTGRVPGIVGNVDQDTFNGKYGDLWDYMYYW